MSEDIIVQKKKPWIKRRGSMKIVIGAFLALLVLIPTFISLFYTPYNPNATSLAERLVAPNAKHWFGTDQLGRDVFSRVMAGGQVSLSIGLMALVGTTFLGVVTGLLSGYFEGPLDAVFNMIAEIRQSMPMMLIIIVFLAIMGSSIFTMGLILAIAEWVTIFRTVRARTMMEKKQDYVTAAITNGAGDLRIIFRYILPNVLPSVIVLSTLMISSVILQESSLSYLGIGVTRPYPSWGRMISDNQSYFINGSWWAAAFPALTIATFVIGINIMADGMREKTKMD